MRALCMVSVVWSLCRLEPADRQGNGRFQCRRRSMEEPLDEAIMRPLQIGDYLQRDMVRLMFDLLTCVATTPRRMMKMSFDMVQQSVESLIRSTRM